MGKHGDRRVLCLRFLGLLRYRLLLLVECRVAHDLLQHLRAANAVGQGQVAHRRVQAVDKLVRPCAVRPLVCEPGDLLCELIKLLPLLAPDLALGGKSELTLTVVSPQAVQGVHIHIRHTAHLREVDPAAFHCCLARDDNEEAACLGISSLEIAPL